MAASTSRAMSSTQCATTPSLHALHNTPMKLLFVRVALVQAGATTLDMAAPLAARLKQVGWHIQFNMPAEHMREAEDVLAKLPVRIVFDHMAHVPQPAGPADPSFEALRRLLDKGNTWVKLSGP